MIEPPIGLDTKRGDRTPTGCEVFEPPIGLDTKLGDRTPAGCKGIGYSEGIEPVSSPVAWIKNQCYLASFLPAVLLISEGTTVRVTSFAHTKVKTSDPVRSQKLSTFGPTQYCGGGPRGNRWWRMFFYP